MGATNREPLTDEEFDEAFEGVRDRETDRRMGGPSREDREVIRAYEEGLAHRGTGQKKT